MRRSVGCRRRRCTARGTRHPRRRSPLIAIVSPWPRWWCDPRGVRRRHPGRAGAAARVVLLIVAAGLARFSISLDLRSLKEQETPGLPVPSATHGALIMNLKSGGREGRAVPPGGRMSRARDRAHRLGSRRRSDPTRTRRDRSRGRRDRHGGRRRSQALVASVAAERGVPMVVVPAGTRNHLALDLGLDRDDVVGGLDAFREAVERPMDLAEVNGRVFVNNVSLGVYAAIVRSPEYRDAKLDTTLSTLPTVLGPDTRPFDLRFTGPDGELRDGAHLIQVSNNPYATRKIGSRPQMDSGTLGVMTLVIKDDRRVRTSCRRSQADIRSGSPGSCRGHHPRSRWIREDRSTWDWTVRPCPWTAVDVHDQGARAARSDPSQRDRVLARRSFDELARGRARRVAGRDRPTGGDRCVTRARSHG